MAATRAPGTYAYARDGWLVTVNAKRNVIAVDARGAKTVGALPAGKRLFDVEHDAKLGWSVSGKTLAAAQY